MYSPPFRSSFVCRLDRNGTHHDTSAADDALPCGMMQVPKPDWTAAEQAGRVRDLRLSSGSGRAFWEFSPAALRGLVLGTRVPFLMSKTSVVTAGLTLRPSDGKRHMIRYRCQDRTEQQPIKEER